MRQALDLLLPRRGAGGDRPGCGATKKRGADRSRRPRDPEGEGGPQDPSALGILQQLTYQRSFLNCELITAP